MCRNVDNIFGSSILDILPNLLQLEVNCFRFKGDRIRDIGDCYTGIIEYSAEQCVWVYIYI